jgi:hypothetical protein
VRPPPDVVRLANQGLELGVQLLLGSQDEVVDPVPPTEVLHLREAWRADLALHPQVDRQAVAADPVHGQEPHVDHERDPRLRGHLLERTDPIDEPTSASYSSRARAGFPSKKPSTE